MTHLPIKGNIRSSIYLVKVASALVKLKGMTNHSNKPSLVLKALFHTSMDSIGIWWYPDLRLSFVKNIAPSYCWWVPQSMEEGIYSSLKFCWDPNSRCTCAKSHVSLELRWLDFHKERRWGGYDPFRSNPGFVLEYLHFQEWIFYKQIRYVMKNEE